MLVGAGELAEHFCSTESELQSNHFTGVVSVLGICTVQTRLLQAVSSAKSSVA